MSEDQQALLLTTARILRATLRDFFPGQVADIADLNEALGPFGPAEGIVENGAEMGPGLRRGTVAQERDRG